MTAQFELDKPTELQFLAQLEKVMGQQKATSTMADAREAIGPINSGDPILPLTKIVLWLSRQKGLGTIVGHSMLIRIKFYNAIYRKEEYARR